MTCNLMNNLTQLQSVFEIVSSSQSGNEWAIFEYDANSNIVMVGATGTSGGLDELVDNLNSAKVQYGFATVAGIAPVDSKIGQNAQRKVIMIHWQGEGVPAARLATTISHAEEIRRFVRHVNLTIHARNEEDLTPEALAKHFEKIQEIAVPMSSNKPVATQNSSNVSTPIAAIPAVAESSSSAVPSSPLSNMSNPVVPSAHAAASPSLLHSPLPSLVTAPPSAFAPSSFVPSKPDDVLQQSQRQTMMTQQYEMMDMQEREKFWRMMQDEEEARRREEADRKRQTQEQYAREQKELTEQLHKMLLERMEADKKQLTKSQSFETAAAAANAACANAKMSKLIAGRTEMFERKLAELSQSVEGKMPPPPKQPKNFKWQVGLQQQSTDPPVNQIPKPPPKQFECVLKRKEQAREAPQQQQHHDQTQETASGWMEGRPIFQNDTATRIPIAPVPPVTRQPPANDTAEEEEKMKLKNEEEHAKDIPNAGGKGGGQEGEALPPISPPPLPPYPPSQQMRGIRAKAIWDYQAEDSSELSFNPEDIITDIQMVHEGWWYGRSPGGNMGLFPANYVQII